MQYVSYAPEALDLASRQNWLAQIKQRIADFRLFLHTLDELQSLNDRELADLGLSRFNLKDIARESVYGK